MNEITLPEIRFLHPETIYILLAAVIVLVVSNYWKGRRPKL